MTDRYPVLLRLAGEPCLVVGGGTVAARKVQGLLAAGASVTVVSPDLGPELAELADGGAVAWEFRPYRRGDACGPWRFVVAATDDLDANQAVVADATAAGTWANDAGAPDGGPAARPAVSRLGPVTVAVATGGAHPGAARDLCDLAATAIGPERAAAVTLLDEVHDEAGPTSPRPDWRAAVDSGMLDLIREGRTAEAKERLQACLSSSSD